MLVRTTSLNLIKSSVGGTPKFSLTKGFVIDPPNLCASSMLNLLAVYASESLQPSESKPFPRLLLVSSTGLSKSSHAALPLALKPLYGYLLRSPHVDKLGMERVVAYAAGWDWKDEEPESEVVGEAGVWRERLGEGGWLKEVVVVRPALLTDGVCKTDGAAAGVQPYRTEEREVKGGYTVSRRDVAHFVVEGALKEWDTWRGKCVRIAY